MQDMLKNWLAHLRCMDAGDMPLAMTSIHLACWWHHAFFILLLLLHSYAAVYNVHALMHGRNNQLVLTFCYTCMHSKISAT